jgi:Fe-S-cluster containining protein
MSGYSVEYSCQRCTKCCRWPGFVKVDAAEITAIAEFVGMKEDEFIARHTRLREDRKGLALLDKPDGSCAWLEGRDCVLQSVKPVQCKRFPNAWNFPGWREDCEAVPRLVKLPVGSV